MNVIHPENQPFSTSEGILALCLYMAGAEFSNPVQPCFHLFDPDILSNLGYRGDTVWSAARAAWKDRKRGHVEYSFKLSQRTHDLIKVYRSQRKELEDKEGKASELVIKIVQLANAGAMLPDEAALRLTCVILAIRGEFMNMWKDVVPLLKLPDKGRGVKFETTAVTNAGRTVPAKGIKKPGYKLISLNASEETRRKMGL